MLHTVKKLLHKVFGLYIIAWFTTVGLLETFAQWTLPFNDPAKTAGLNVWWAGTDTWDTLITIIKNAINYALTFLWFIALASLLWGGYKMVASGGDEGAYKEGIKILKNAAIGIAFIAISALLVNFIMYVLWLIVVA